MKQNTSIACLILLATFINSEARSAASGSSSIIDPCDLKNCPEDTVCVRNRCVPFSFSFKPPVESNESTNSTDSSASGMPVTTSFADLAH
uniref:Uncharacterized protein n=1 Tax=Plectus sambesii TaxID=2011161 RepID=A0A914XHG9_9BILA